MGRQLAHAFRMLKESGNSMVLGKDSWCDNRARDLDDLIAWGLA
jgi:hypothetical protein